MVDPRPRVGSLVTWRIKLCDEPEEEIVKFGIVTFVSSTGHDPVDLVLWSDGHQRWQFRHRDHGSGGAWTGIREYERLAVEVY